MFKNIAKNKKERNAFLVLNKAIDISKSKNNYNTLLTGIIASVSFGGVALASQEYEICVLLMVISQAITTAYYFAIDNKKSLKINKDTMYNSFKNYGLIENDDRKEAVTYVLDLYKYSYEKIIDDLNAGKITNRDKKIKTDRLVKDFTARLKSCQHEERLMEEFN